MNIIRNDKIIKRNTMIARYSMFGGLIVLMGGLFLSFRNPQNFSLSMTALMVGFLLSQVGIFYANRWGRSPRPDEMIDAALKGLDKKYSIYHYTTPAHHLLVGPSGVWIILPYYQRGRISYSNGRWRQRGSNLYLKIFAQEGLGRPDMDIASESEAVMKVLRRELPEESLPQIQAVLVFTNPRAVIEMPEDASPPAETVYLKDLKDTIRKSGKTKSMTLDRITGIQEALGVIEKPVEEETAEEEE